MTVEGKQKNGKFGYSASEVDILIPFEYDSIGEFIDGRAKAKKAEKLGYTDYFIDRMTKAHGGNYIKKLGGYIDDNGRELIQNSEIINGNLRKGEKFEKWGVESLDGNTIISFEYDFIEDFIDGRAKAKKNGMCGYIDQQGEILFPFVYDTIENFIDGRAKAKKNGDFGQIGYVDYNGNELIQNSARINSNLRKGEKFGK